MSNTTRSYDIAAACFCLLALAISMTIGHFHQVGHFGTETDFLGSYAPDARSIMAGRGYSYPYQPPGYPILVAAVSFLSSDMFVAGKVISAFGAALFGWLTYLLLKELFDSRIALASTILCLPVLIPDSFVAATDMIAAAGLALSLWLLLRRPVLTSRICFLTGLSAGTAYLLRTEALFLIVGVGLSLFFIGFNQEVFRIRLFNTGIFVSGVLLITSPWLIYNWTRNGSPLASATHLVIAAHFYNPQGDWWQELQDQEGLRFTSIFQVLSYDPLRILKMYLKDVLYGNPKELVQEGLQFPAYLFAGAGFLLLPRDLTKRRIVYFATCLLGYFSLGLAGFRFRYFLFFLPLLFLLVAYFLFQKQISDMLGEVRFVKVSISWVIVGVLVICLGYNAYKQVRWTLDTEPRYLLETAKFLRDRSSPGDIIFVRKPHLAYLTDLQAVFYPLETADQFLAKAQEIGARYVVYSDFEARIWPGLKSLSDPHALSHDFKLIYSHEATHTLIYEIAPKKF